MGYAYQILTEENLVMNIISGSFTFDDYLALMEAILEIDYGLSRMYQMISEDLPVAFEVFYDE